MDYEEFEKNVEKERERNDKLIKEFKDYMKKAGLSDKTIGRHTNNIDFYINHCLLYEDIEIAESGIYKIDYFLGYWFIKKAMWSSVNTVKENITSIKKFYLFMYESGYDITLKDIKELNEEIKENKKIWLNKIDRYNNDMSYSLYDDFGNEFDDGLDD